MARARYTREQTFRGMVDMGTVTGAQQILAGLKEAGIDLVSSVPDINMLQLINLLYEDKDIAHVPVGREEEGIGVCAGAHLGGKKTAMLMQNGGLLNSCNGLTTTALQFGRAQGLDPFAVRPAPKGAPAAAHFTRHHSQDGGTQPPDSAS